MKRCNRIHGHCGRSTRLMLAALGAGLSLGLGGAGADEPSAGVLPVTGLAEHLAREAEDRGSRPPRWLGENWFYKKHVGLEYRRELKLGGHAFEARPPGPAGAQEEAGGSDGGDPILAGPNALGIGLAGLVPNRTQLSCAPAMRPAPRGRHLKLRLPGVTFLGSGDGPPGARFATLSRLGDGNPEKMEPGGWP